MAAATAVAVACKNGNERLGLSLERAETSEEALQRLREGNERFRHGRVRHPNQTPARRKEVAGGQQPWALIWGCMDSRVVPELLFDQGLGDIFVVRTAGQVIDASGLGSVEFAAEEFHIPLVLVLGHEGCGAIVAAIDSINEGANAPGSIGAIVASVRPAYEQARNQNGDVVANTVRANVRLQVSQLKASPVIAPLVQRGSLRIAGAVYDIHSGSVDFTVA